MCIPYLQNFSVTEFATELSLVHVFLLDISFLILKALKHSVMYFCNVYFLAEPVPLFSRTVWRHSQVT